MQNTMKKTILPVIMWFTVILAGCSNYNQATQAKITELEHQEKVAQVACDKLQRIQLDKTNLQTYIDNQKPKCTQGYALCVDKRGEAVFGNICYEDYTFKEGANYFENYEGAYVNKDYKCLIKENEEALTIMLDERPVFN